MQIAIDDLISKMQWAATNGLTELSIDDKNSRVTILRESTSGQAGVQVHTESAVESTAEITERNSDSITAPLSGICYLASDSGTSPFISIGDRVAEGETLCVIEAMKVMTPVIASVEGFVEELLVEDGASVTAGDPLVRIRR